MFDDIKEQNKTSIRLALNSSKVKLWLKPYSNEDGSKDQPADALTVVISERVNIPKVEVEEVIEELRVHSFKKFQATIRFRETGIALLSLKVVSSTQAMDNDIPKEDSDWIEMKLDNFGSYLTSQLSKQLKISSNNLKLIYNGRNVEDDISLEQQGIRNLCSILVLRLDNEESGNYQETEHEQLIGRAKKAANLINNKKFYGLELTDQRGKPLDIPKEEKRALSVAMMLHEKGRSSMKKKNYGLALVYLLEADSEFIKCTSDILDVVDNYALLSLDIVWCYYYLQQVSSLHDAENRLALCDKKLRKTYGLNMERVTKLRGGSSKELAVVVRLHLMQGAIYYYQGLHDKAMELFEKTDRELKPLCVDEHAMISVMEMGFSETKARLALRFCNGDVSSAIEHIVEERQENNKIKEEERRKKMNKTFDGNQLDIQLLQYLTNIGFDERSARFALRKNNNDLTSALNFLTTPLAPKNLKRKSEAEKQLQDMPELNQLISLGFDIDTVTEALKKCNTVEEMIAFLKEKCMLVNFNPTTEQLLIALLTDYFANNKDDEDDDELVQKELNDVNLSSDDYLDFTLDEEAAILQDFKAKLLSLGYNFRS